jgi:lipid-A-disaccharide synthase
MFVILPFEKDFYRKYGYDVSFVGHPLLDAVTDYHEGQPSAGGHAEKPLISLLPGSRKQEISRMLPVMAEVAATYRDHSVVVAAAPSIDDEFYQGLTDGKVRLERSGVYSVLSNSHAALVTSGTATLETALFKVPQVVCYKGSTLSYFIARHIVSVPFISLVNLIMGREVVKELVQNDFKPKKLKAELDNILKDKVRRRIIDDYGELAHKLGGPGASDATAKEILEILGRP